MEILIILTILRLLVPLSILRWPLFGIIASMLLDAFDFHVLAYFGAQHLAYDRWDKALDTYYLGIAAYTALSWKDRLARNIGIVLYGYRLLGVILFLITDNRTLLLIFPNFFEFYFIFVLLYIKFANTPILFKGLKSTIPVLFAVMATKILQEYFMHVLKTEPIYYFNIHDLFPIIDELHAILRHIIQLVFTTMLPIAVLIWKIRQSKRGI